MLAQINIKPETYQYPELISKIEQGLIKIPAFQREFVWSMDKTLFLLDSISRRYPIGTFLFWQSSDFINALRNIGSLNLNDPPSGYPVQYVLDGQQRVTSLYAALRSAHVNRQHYRICADLDSYEQSEEVFFAREPDDERFILLSDLLGDDYGPLFASLTSTRQKRFNDIRTTFLNYPFSVTLVEGGNLDIVCDLFERINNTGVELSVFDLLVARTWLPIDEDGGFDLRAALDELRETVDDVNFSNIPEAVIAQLAGALIKHDCTRKAILSIGREEMRVTWPKLADSFCSAVDFVRKKLRIATSRLLPYPSLLLPLAYFFFRNGKRNPDGNQSSWLMRYFYLNGFSGRLSSGTQSKLTDDLRILDSWVAGEAVIFNVPVSITAIDIQNTPLQLSNAYCKSLLCLLSANKPLDFRDGSDVILQSRFLKRANSRQFHHIFPKAYIRGKAGAEEVNSIVNIALIPADLNLKIGKRPPSHYLAEFNDANPDWSSTLDSHIIDSKAKDALEIDDFHSFLEHRSHRLAKLISDAIGADPSCSTP